MATLNWLTYAFSASLEINGKLLTGLKLVSNLKGFVYWSVNMGVGESRHSFKCHVGTGSLLHCLFGSCLISFLTSSYDRGSKERNISSSFNGTLGIAIDSGSWFSNLLIFLIFIIKKSPNMSARSFNESESGHCSCCNAFVRDLMVLKSFFWSPAHSWTFPK